MKALPKDIERALRQVIVSEAKRKGGLSGYRLAKLSGVAAAMISRFARGERTVTLTTAAKLAKALGLRLTDDPGTTGKG